MFSGKEEDLLREVEPLEGLDHKGIIKILGHGFAKLIKMPSG